MFVLYSSVQGCARCGVQCGMVAEVCVRMSTFVIHNVYERERERKRKKNERKSIIMRVHEATKISNGKIKS